MGQGERASLPFCPRTATEIPSQISGSTVLPAEVVLNINDSDNHQCRDSRHMRQCDTITEAALQASSLNHTGCLRTVLHLSSVMHTGVHNCAVSYLTKALLSPLRFLRWYESIVPYSFRSGVLAQFSQHHSCISSLYPPSILRRKVARKQLTYV